MIVMKTNTIIFHKWDTVRNSYEILGIAYKLCPSSDLDRWKIEGSLFLQKEKEHFQGKSDRPYLSKV